MRIRAASCASLRDVISGPIQQLSWLGASTAAAYGRAESGEVIVVLRADAVRLPGSIVLAAMTAGVNVSALLRYPCTAVAATIGRGELAWRREPSPDSEQIADRVADHVPDHVVVQVRRLWAPPQVRPGAPMPDRVAAAARLLRGRDIGSDLGVDDQALAQLARSGSSEAARTAALHLLGRGPGLTPSGDDVLAGYVLGCLSFTRDDPGVGTVIAESSAVRTSALSAQLLHAALGGRCAAPVAAFTEALCGRGEVYRATGALLAVGHTSGAALALGVLAAAGVVPARLRDGGLEACA